jgi:signal transduction histidine kinase
MAKGGHLRMTVTAEREPAGDEWVVLAVQDEGCGIAPEDVDGIFQPFRSSFERGTGLGLATVHRVVTDYNGTINVASQVGVGTIMSVRLPVHAGISETPAESESRSAVV